MSKNQRNFTTGKFRKKIEKLANIFRKLKKFSKF